MERRNKIWIGLLAGILLPVLSLTMLHQIFSMLETIGGVSDEGFSPNFRARTLAILAIALNLILLHLFRKRRWDLAMRGVVIATTILAAAWVGVYGVKLF
jgi:uncharacterized BrkB/YihY/UPF0761 family membrane protein